eukprot:GEMP01009365.1.p1 GENE.GEMP01009365.1~~GEMP01009365.1.p1  ORF type:complete len:454 (+),score=107.65 GEMP01009365.1:637-1998(+)
MIVPQIGPGAFAHPQKLDEPKYGPNNTLTARMSRMNAEQMEECIKDSFGKLDVILRQADRSLRAEMVEKLPRTARQMLHDFALDKKRRESEVAQSEAQREAAEHATGEVRNVANGPDSDASARTEEDCTDTFTSDEDRTSSTYSRGHDCNQYVAVAHKVYKRHLVFRVRVKLGKGLYLAADKIESVSEMVRWHIVLVYALIQVERIKAEVPPVPYETRVRSAIQLCHEKAENLFEFQKEELLRMVTKYTWIERRHFNMALSSPYQSIENTIKARQFAKLANSAGDYKETLDALGHALTRNFEDMSHIVPDGGSRGSLRPRPFVNNVEAMKALEHLKTKELPPHMWPKGQYDVRVNKAKEKNPAWRQEVSDFPSSRGGHLKRPRKKPEQTLWQRFENARHCVERYLREQAKRTRKEQMEAKKVRKRDIAEGKIEARKKRKLEQEEKLLPGLCRQ